MLGGRLPARIAVNFLLAVLYVSLGTLGLSLSVLQVTPVWPPSGLCLAAVLLLGYGVWPGVFIGAFVLNCTSYFNPALPVQSCLIAAGVAAGSTLEALAGGWLVRRYASGPEFLNRAEDVLRFCYLGAFTSAAISSACGTLSLFAYGSIQRADLRITGLTWWMGDTMGILVVTPLIVAWVRERHGAWDFARVMEALGLCALVYGLGILAFGSLEFRVEYMMIPCLIWAAFRFRQKGATLVMALLSGVAIYGTVHNRGSFVLDSVNDSLLLLQAFLGVIAITTLILSAILAERSQSTAKLVAAIQETEKARREAEEANLAKSAFFFNVNHELRTPLNHIIGYSDLLKEEAADAGKADLVPDIRKINEAGKHLLGLISQILDLSALEMGRMEPAVEEFGVAELVAEAAAAARPLAEKNGNRLDVRIPDDAGTMKSDRSKVREILAQVLHNAGKFTHAGNISLNVAPDPDHVVFSIRDTGIGIANDQLERLFRPFAQASAGATREYGGLGLGLSICRLYCKLLGGDITVESKPGKGSAFTIRLPRNIQPFG